MTEQENIYDSLKLLISERNSRAISEAISEMEAVDIAHFFEALEDEERVFLYELMDNEVSAEMLLYVDEDLRKNFLKNFLKCNIYASISQNNHNTICSLVCGL